MYESMVDVRWLRVGEEKKKEEERKKKPQDENIMACPAITYGGHNKGHVTPFKVIQGQLPVSD